MPSNAHVHAQAGAMQPLYSNHISVLKGPGVAQIFFSTHTDPVAAVPASGSTPATPAVAEAVTLKHLQVLNDARATALLHRLAEVYGYTITPPASVKDASPAKVAAPAPAPQHPAAAPAPEVKK